MGATGGADSSGAAAALPLLIGCGLCQSLSLEIAPDGTRNSQLSGRKGRPARGRRKARLPLRLLRSGGKGRPARIRS